MKQRTKANIIFVFSIILLATVISLPFISGVLNKYTVHCPDAINGYADFQNTKITSFNPLYLQGEWIKYDGHIISDKIEPSHEGTIQEIPPRLPEIPVKIESNSGKIESYKLRVKNLEFPNATIHIPHFAGSYRIYVNNRLVSLSGRFDDKNTYANLRLSSFPINFQKNVTYDIVIEIACEVMPGIYMTPVIAGYDYVNTYTNVATSLRCLAIGIVFACGLYLLIYSIINQGLFTSKWLPVLCFLIALRMTISTEGFTAFGFLFPSVNYEYITLIICISTFIIKLIALLFYTETLDLNIKKGTFITFCTVFLGCTIIASLFPFTVFNPYYFIILQASTLPLDIVLLGHLSNSMARKVRFSTTYTIGYIAMISGIMIDCFYTNGLIQFNASSFMPAAFCLFAVVFAVVLSKKITDLYKTALKAAELDKELTSTNTALMLSQIQPHFLYNALNTIKYLIKREPKKAEKAVISFSKYLRRNMDSLTENSPIPFSQELEHIKNYCEIELLRFEDKLTLIYDTDYIDFLVPSLTVQPLVENAIKHGVTKKAEGGTVKISTFCDDKFNYITVEDNGIGFDPDNHSFSPDENHSHIGLHNVEKRLKNMMNASMTVESESEKGTTITIKIPKEENRK